MVLKKVDLVLFDNTKQIVWFDVKSLFTNVPLSDVIEIALTCLYSGDSAQDKEKQKKSFKNGFDECPFRIKQ